ncbi:agamous-like MADS-box protein AGL80 [Primulina huaijiensis]|uniref:agamous-like MADS-box protein AGL80 n=1 Tax=Primulina huaijiensis TaxID=1492673 RepID=UPI003CC77A94
MARNKLTLAYIDSDAERKASFKKRKKGLIKKVSEIKVLCGVEACVVIYSPYEAPVVWPSPEVARTVIRRFKNLPEIEKTKKMVNQESFAQHQIKRAEERLRKLQKEIKRKELRNFMYMVIEGKASIDDFDFRDAREMNYIIHETLEEITWRMKALKEAGADGAPSAMSPGGGSGGDGGGPPENSSDSTPGSRTIPFI